MNSEKRKVLRHEYEVVLENQAVLGEGPAWDEKRHALLWVDIVKHTINRLDVRSGKNQSVPFSATIGSVVPRQSGGYTLATDNGLIALSDDLKIGDLIAPLTISKEEQMNDGKCDALGRYWTGTLAIDRKSPVGALYCIDEEHRIEQKLTDAIVSNGMGWNAKQDKMYYIDTKKNAIFQFDFDLKTGQIKNRQVFVDLSNCKGGGDGMTLDVEDCLWVAQWDSGEIHRYKPDGTLDYAIPMPVRRVTSCCFGGDDLTDLYVTSSKNGLTEQQLKEQPLSGSIFKVKVGVKGVPTYAYAG